MMLCRISLSLALICSGFLFGADQKVQYYKVKPHTEALQPDGTDETMYVPKSYFDNALQTGYVAKCQRQAFVCKKEAGSYHVIDIIFRRIKGQNYQQGDNEKEFMVLLSTTTPMNDAPQFEHKDLALKYIEENAKKWMAAREKQYGFALWQKS